MKRALFLLLALFLFTSYIFAADSVVDLIRRGDELLKQKQFAAAYKSYSEANKKLSNKCSRCLVGMGYAKGLNGENCDALKLMDKALAVAADASERADAHATKGDIYMMYWKSEPKYLPLAEAEFRAALVDSPQYHALHAKLGLSLGRQKRDPEAIQELNVYLAAVPDGAGATQVRQWIAEPRRMRSTVAPEFAIKTLSGDQVTLAALSGKVVVLDFWATWCPPCVASVDELKELRKKYPADKLVVISVSADDDETKWQEFVAKKRMDWPQYHDGQRTLRRLYDVHSYPTYIVIDTEGLIRERVEGQDPLQSIASRLKKQLKELLAN